MLRIEKRAADTDEARAMFPTDYEYHRQWIIISNSPLSLSTLLSRFKDSELWEYRMKPYEENKDDFNEYL